MRFRIFAGSLCLYAFPLLTLAHAENHPEVVTSVPLVVVLAGGLLAGLLGTALLHRTYKSTVVALVAGVVISVFTGGALSLLAHPAQQVATTTAYPELAGVRMEVYKSPGCSCCGGFIAELRDQSADVVVREVTDEELSRVKEEHGVRDSLQSCHTMLVDGYVVEGHVPFEVIAKLLTERPKIDGIALPGMPIGTPGMPGSKTEPYSIKTLSGEEYVTL